MTETQSEVISSSTNSTEPSLAATQLINKFMQGIKDESKFGRKNSLESIKKQINDSIKAKEGDKTAIRFNSEAIKQILKLTLTLWNDPIEKCRELSLEIVKLILDYSISDKSFWDSDMTGMVIMQLHQRLGGKEVKEPSEEIRLELLNLIYSLIEHKSEPKHSIEIYFQELVSILINSFNDNYPEAKKKACSCAKLLANKLSGSVFHMQSESLIKPLLTNITHQHSRVRKDIIDCLCDVVLHGNNKVVTEIIPHLAQRLFDQANLVRMAVVKLVGTWLLDLPDRYSFHSKLIPLILTGFIDESIEINELAESLWWDVGIKYHKENDEDLKDKASFLEQDLPNYPSEFKDRRPNLGCRELIRLNASKILPGILNDIGDWVEATRIKSIELLFIMIWQAEINITQHLETVLQTLFKASQEKLDKIQTNIFKCSKLVGNFTDSNVTLGLAFKTIRRIQAPNHGSINILNGLLIGHDPFRISPNILIDTLEFLNEISVTVDVQLQIKIIDCCQTLLPLIKNETFKSDETSFKKFEYLLFKILFTVIALTNDNSLKEKITPMIQSLNQEKIKSAHLPSFINEIRSNCDSWNDNSLEPYIFSRLINDCGLSQLIFDQVIYILKTSLIPEKDVQLRSKFLLLIPEIFLKSNEKSEENQNYLKSCLNVIVSEMILPNIIWKAGRTAGAVRMSACACLVLVLQSDLVKEIKIDQGVLFSLFKQLLSTLDDENKNTRLYVTQIMQLILTNKQNSEQFDKDQLHKLYPELIKRLDDQCEEIRHETFDLFSIYIDCLNKNYDNVLYQAHLQVIYENLLLYLDDSSLDIQLKAFDLIKKSRVLGSEILKQECLKVRDKHRNVQYCDDIIKLCEENK